ncbi:urease accessory protein UreE, partial [Rhizobium ruizarguesonis]
EMVMVDLKDPVLFANGDQLVRDDGELIEIIAADEKLFEVSGRDRTHLVELAWHLGNRHLAAQIEQDSIVILRYHVIRTML